MSECVDRPRVAASETRPGPEGPGTRMTAVQALAAVIAHPAMPGDVRAFEGLDTCDRCTRALGAAEAVLAAGYALVSEEES